MKCLSEESRTLGEFLLEPGRTTKKHVPDAIRLKTQLTKYSIHDPTLKSLQLNIPITSAIMQAVSDDNLAIALAKEGGLSFIFASQSIEDQCSMVERVKKYKAGFVTSDSNLKPTDTLATIIKLKKEKGHSAMPVTDDGSPTGKLLGIVTSSDYWIGFDPNDKLVSELMTPIDKLVCGYDGISLSEANDMLWKNRRNILPVITKEGALKSLVFRKDYDHHFNNHNELLDNQKRFMVGAGINTKDYKIRIPALIKAGVDVLCIDSSDGDSDWVREVLLFVRKNYGNDVKIGAGNIVSGKSFISLVKAGADFIKVGIGGGSICITREQKGIGCGQATAVMEVAKARDKYFKETGIYVPICSDGSIVLDNHVTIALAMGADFVMMGRYFARFEEAPGKKMVINGNTVKGYWGEGADKAQNWQRYNVGGKESTLKFEEGVEGYVPYAGKLKDNLEGLLYKIRSTMCNCGSIDLSHLRKNAVLRPVSLNTIREGGFHDIIIKKE